MIVEIIQATYLGFGIAVLIGIQVVPAISLTVASAILTWEVITTFFINIPYKPAFATLRAWVLSAGRIKGKTEIVIHRI